MNNNALFKQVWYETQKIILWNIMDKFVKQRNLSSSTKKYDFDIKTHQLVWFYWNRSNKMFIFNVRNVFDLTYCWVMTTKNKKFSSFVVYINFDDWNGLLSDWKQFGETNMVQRSRVSLQFRLAEGKKLLVREQEETPKKRKTWKEDMEQRRFRQGSE